MSQHLLCLGVGCLNGLVLLCCWLLGSLVEGGGWDGYMVYLMLVDGSVGQMLRLYF